MSGRLASRWAIRARRVSAARDGGAWLGAAGAETGVEAGAGCSSRLHQHPLNSNSPKISVAAIAKRDLNPGDKIKKGIGSFDVRGIAVKIKDHKGHVPIGLMKDAIIKRLVVAGTELTFDDVELPDSLALRAWQSIEKKVLED